MIVRPPYEDWLRSPEYWISVLTKTYGQFGSVYVYVCIYIYIYIYTHIYTCYIVVIVRPPYEGRRGCGAEPRDRRHRAGGDRGGSKCHNPDLLLLLLVLLLLLLLLVVVVVYEHI